MTNIDWVRFAPFAIVAVNLLCWSLIEHFSGRPWNIAKVTILMTGYTVMLYIGSLALNYSWFDVDWPPDYYDVIRVLMGTTVIGTPFLIRNAWWAFQNWRDREVMR